MSWSGPDAASARDADLDLRGLAGLLRRTLPFLRGLRRHLAVLTAGSVVLLLLGLASFMILAPALWTGVLQGKSFSPVAARLLGLDPAAVAGGADALLPAELRRAAGERLTWILGGFIVAMAAAVMALIYYSVWILQRLNQSLRMQLVDRLQALSLRFHDQTRGRRHDLPDLPGQRDGDAGRAGVPAARRSRCCASPWWRRRSRRSRRGWSLRAGRRSGCRWRSPRACSACACADASGTRARRTARSPRRSRRALAGMRVIKAFGPSAASRRASRRLQHGVRRRVRRPQPGRGLRRGRCSG